MTDQTLNTRTETCIYDVYKKRYRGVLEIRHMFTDSPFFKQQSCSFLWMVEAEGGSFAGQFLWKYKIGDLKDNKNIKKANVWN